MLAYIEANMKEQMENDEIGESRRTLDVNPADITFRSRNTIIAERIICNVAEMRHT